MKLNGYDIFVMKIVYHFSEQISKVCNYQELPCVPRWLSHNSKLLKNYYSAQLKVNLIMMMTKHP